MHVAVDLNWFLQFILTAFVLAFGVLHLVRNTASKYFVVDDNFGSEYSFDRNKKRTNMQAQGKVGGAAGGPDPACAVCGLSASKQCAGCKMVKYCSEDCQKSHWESEHKRKCKDLKLLCESSQSASTSRRRRASTSVALVPAAGTPKITKPLKEVLFPYEEFLEFFNWDKEEFPPCGLLNCGNSCFANVVLQCLTYTRPLVAYLLDNGHQVECIRDEWCFLCEFEIHVKRARSSVHPFSPINILSHLPNIGGSLGYGKQEDAHEFMRFAIDTMQSVCLDEFGGEKVVPPSSQETTLIQHIFGGQLQSQVICTKCNNVSNQFENMMDLTVEIHGDAASLEECLDQFTAKEQLHGDNMYKCDGCNDYVMAWKRLTVRRAPNILTIALKRFQSGRFGKLNKRVTFPEVLDLNPYMSEAKDGNDSYKLYAVIVHVDMLNASFFGHYICYIKDFRGRWYRVDDCKVARVDLDEVLSQSAYMLMYSRISARPLCLHPTVSLRRDAKELQSLSAAELVGSSIGSRHLSSEDRSEARAMDCDGQLLSIPDSGDARGDIEMVDSRGISSFVEDVELRETNGSSTVPQESSSPFNHAHEQVPVDGALSDAYSTESNVLKTEPLSDAGNKARINGGNASECLLSSKYSPTMQNNVGDKGDKADRACVEVLTDRNPVHSNSTSERNRYGDQQKSSGAKLRPIFAPGFLSKRPRKGNSKSEVKFSIEPDEMASNSNPGNQTNGVTQPCISGQSDHSMNVDQNTCYGDSSSYDHVNRQNGLVENKIGRATGESHIYIENGDSGHSIVSGVNRTNGRLEVGNGA